MWFANSDCHPDRARTTFVLRCDRCRAEWRGTLPGYATEAAMRRAGRAQGWRYATATGLDGKRTGNDACPACAGQAGQPRQAATRAPGPGGRPATRR